MNIEEFYRIMGLSFLEGSVFQELTKDGMNSTLAEDVEKLNEKARALVDAINNNPLGYVDGSLENVVNEFKHELRNIQMYGEDMIPLNVPNGVSQNTVNEYVKKIYNACDNSSYNMENGVKDAIANDPKVIEFNENERKKQEEKEREILNQAKESYAKVEKERARLFKELDDVIEKQQKEKEEWEKQKEEEKRLEEEKKRQEEERKQALEKEKAEQQKKERDERFEKKDKKIEKDEKEAEERKRQEAEKKQKEEEQRQKEEEEKKQNEEKRKQEEIDARKKIDPNQQKIIDLELQIETIKERMAEGPAVAKVYEKILKKLESQKQALERNERFAKKEEKPDVKRLSKEELQKQKQIQKDMAVADNKKYKDKIAAQEKELEKTGYSTKGLFGKYTEKLEAAQTSYNSSVYVDLVKKLNAVNDGSLKFKGDITPKQKYVLQLVMIKKQIDKYIDHKAQKGVKQNSYKKLAAVEELNVEISKRLQGINCDSFNYNGKDVDKAAFHLSYESEVNAYIAKNSYNKNRIPIRMDAAVAQKLADRAKANYPDANAVDIRNVDNCMCRILLASFGDKGKIGKYSVSINEMKRQFYDHPADKKVDMKKNAKQTKPEKKVEKPEKKPEKQPKKHRLS